VTKVPRTSAPGDDAVVGQTVPSTTADPSKETVTTRRASSFGINDAGCSGGKVLIVRPPPKFSARKLALTRAPK